MTTDNTAKPMLDNTDNDLDPISPEAARAAIDAAMREQLGENWRDNDSKFFLVHEAPYLVRVNHGATNLDFQCDLLGHVDVIERPANPLQTSGRMIAWMVLIATMLVVMTIASLAGVFNLP